MKNVVDFPARNIRPRESRLQDELSAATARFTAELPFPSDETMLRYMAARRAFIAELTRTPERTDHA
jgi:hypothetical protein